MMDPDGLTEQMARLVEESGIRLPTPSELKALIDNPDDWAAPLD